MAAKPPGKEKFKAPLKGTPKHTSPPFSRVLYLIMALVAVVILVGGYLFYRDQAQQMHQRIEGGLSIVAQLKADQIAEWRTERLTDADMLVGSPFFAEGVEKYLASPTDTEAKDKVLARLAVIKKAYPYQDMLLTDVNGKVLLSLNDSVPRLSDMTLAQLPVAIKERKAVMVDFHYPPDSNFPHLDVVAPLFPWGQDSPQAIGAVVFCIDPSQYLYPLLQSSPMPSETAETLLVERDGDQVLFLNELRHQKDTALKLRIPLSQQEVPAVMAVLGKEGVVEGKDYRGVEVLSALKHIPDSPWYMVAKIDTSEAISAGRFRTSMTMALVAGLLAAALAGIGFIWQRRQRLAYQALYQAGLETQALRSHFEYLVKYANDIIYLTDENYHIVEVNDRALEAYGYTRQEMLGMPLAALISPGGLSSYQARLRKIQQKGTIVAEGIHQRKDGSTFPVEVSGRIIKVEDKTYLQGIVRDITQRKRVEEDILSQYAIMNAIIESQSAPIFTVDKNYCYTTFNSSHAAVMKALFGADIEIGKSLLDYHTVEADRKQAKQNIDRALSGESITLESYAGEESLSRRFFEIAHNPVINAVGQVIGASVFARDLTARKRAEKALQQSEERYRTILEETEEGYYEVDLAGTFTSVNDTGAQLLDHSRKKLIGMNYRSIFSEQEQQNLFKAFSKVYQTGQPVRNLLFEAIAGDDGNRVGELSVFPLRNEKGEIISFRGVGREITERKKAEEALQQSEDRYRTILKEIADSYFEVDLAGNLTFVNDATCHNLGYSREELLGINYRDFSAKEDIEHVYQVFNQVYRTGKPNKGFLWKVIRKDESIGFADASVSLLRSQGGEIIGFRGVGRDITERKMAEEKRIQLELKAQIASRLASVGEMAAGVAHEINNPLTAVTGYAQLLVDREDVPSDIRSDLAAINDGARRVAGIVRTLLAFSRQTKPQRKLADINELIESTLVLRAYHLRVNNIEVVTRLVPDLLETVVDPGQIQQVLLNLIVNAEMEMKLAYGKGKLTITTKKSDNTIKICFQDNGPGIKPEVMDKIFDPFFTTREVGEGTGLGLSLCYGIVAEHKGKIYAESKPGKGATFIIELPVVTEVAPPKPAEPDAKKPEKAVKARILVVDDEQVVRDVVNRVLTGEGHKVDAVDNAVDALKKIESQRYKLILVDIKMPGIDGVELYKRIKKIAEPLARKVVFITGDIMGADTEKFLSETKVAHIGKPFNAEQLSREVQHALTGGR